MLKSQYFNFGIVVIKPIHFQFYFFLQNEIYDKRNGYFFF